MTGPEHYREAEQLLAYIEDGAYRDRMHLSEAAEHSIAARAQVHATLALAAATALAGERLPFGDFAAWNEVAGVPAPNTKAVNGRG
ncbi:hypothetical protein Lesp02_70450 [Lentzea sp. NBRC 105346]|uniref:hypothetical protein n=1 Tax=Lentzea sp. NBRC 105346 TaxID=3032205 RepID=UPI0024A40D3D|nr:hypothetical protein [Lentzea sp. NBRC 105346]GLZ34858.1 hypothetical protein Lesp02_70450 [Lentzea sp. NBRC 105346]